MTAFIFLKKPIANGGMQLVFYLLKNTFMEYNE